ncbi:MAG: Mut7-C RNAse domain-containing protein [Nitrososphaerales archaeon]
MEPHKQNFLVDGMLGSTAVKLRILGYDTVYDKISKDDDLLKHSKEEKRILVTSDQELCAKAIRNNIQAILTRASSDDERLVEIFRKLNIKEVDLSKGSRCSQCNGLLEETEDRDAKNRAIYVCEKCGKRFWHGSHWKKLEELFTKVNHELGK